MADDIVYNGYKHLHIIGFKILNTYIVGRYIMRNADEAICKSPDNHRKLIDVLGEFTTSVGADPLFGNYKPTSDKYIGSYKATKNKFSDGLLSNVLDQFLSRRAEYIGSVDISEMHQILKSCIYNSQQAIQGYQVVYE